MQAFARLLVALVSSAQVPVITVQNRPRDTNAVDARIVNGAKVEIAARRRHVLMLATSLGKTEVLGTGIAVVAGNRVSRHAPAVKASIAGGTGIAIIAGYGVSVKNTAGRGVAAIVGTRIAVIAVNRPAAQTFPAHARFSCGAGIAVTARKFVVDMTAADRRVTGVGGAQVIVIAVQRSINAAHPVGAMGPDGAEIAVITLGVVGRMNTKPFLTANVVCTRIGVVAIQ